MGARHYDPVSGRFLSQDPIGYPITLNLYTYVNGDPINFYDPDGRFISPAYQTISATRLMGALQIAGGAAETLVGAGLTYVSGGLALPIGTAAMAHGLDHFFTGINTVYTGKQQDTLTSHLLQQTGMSHGSAETIDMSLSLGFTMGGSALLNSVRSAATATQFANAALIGHAATATSQNEFTPIIRSNLTEAVQPYTRSNLKLGRQMHNNYKLGVEGRKEYILPSGKRIDFLDIENGIIYELKPNNPRAVNLGKKQLGLYAEEIITVPKFSDIKWKTILETY